MLKSFKKRSAVIIFFILSFTFAILTFSVGNSAINQQKEKAKKYTKENNIIVSFIECSDISMDEIIDLLENIDITISVSKYEIDIGVEIATVLQMKSFDIKEDMITGNFYTIKDFKKDKIGGIYSNILANKDIEVNSSVYGKKINIIKDGVFYDNKAKIIVTNKTFENLYDLENINQNNFSILLSGEKDKLEIGYSLLNEYIKNKDNKNNLLKFPYLLDDRSIEGEALYSAAILILLITLINSVTLSSLWVETRKKEIVLRKAFGAENKDIARLFFYELIFISIIATLLALITQYFICLFTDGYIYNVSIKLTANNFIYSSVVAILTAFMASIPSLMYLQKVQPVDLLRED